MYKKTLTFKKSHFVASIDLELRDLDDNKIEFSAYGSIKENGKIIRCGQCIDSIAKLFPKNSSIKRIEEIWKEYHLNSLHAGCIHQRAFEKEPYEKHMDEHCSICDYTYGTKWIYEPLPESIIEEIKSF